METEPDITDPHRTPLPVSQDDDDEVPGLAPAPGAPLSPRTAAMVLEAAGKTDGDMLVKNAKDFAATIRQLKKRMDETQDRALEAENRLEELLSNKENEPPVCNHSSHRNRSSSTATYDQPEYEGVCPVGFEENTGQATGFYIPDDDGNQQEPKFIRFVQGANPHAEGTRGQGFPIFLHHLYAPADYEETDLPMAQLPIWFTAALSRHSSMYNVVLRAALEHNNWGVCADIIRYRQAEDQIGIWEARVEEASQRVERAREGTGTNEVPTWRPRGPTATSRTSSALTSQKTGNTTTTPAWSFPFASWHDEDDDSSEVADDLRTRGGMMKPAAVLGSGPSSVRREGEPARWPGRVLLRPDFDSSWFVSDPDSLVIDYHAGYDS
jgi:hypothetical protein